MTTSDWLFLLTAAAIIGYMAPDAAYLYPLALSFDME
jgi:hypothetical protein